MKQWLFLSLTLRTIPVGIAYAIWSGVGIVLVTLITWFALGKRSMVRLCLDWRLLPPA
ncbi:MAG: SMR family transporter [Nitrosospira sp.]